jgi:hypothetical protein
VRASSTKASSDSWQGTWSRGARKRGADAALHLVFALATTAYILVAIELEERDLIEAHGDRYESYRSQVSMLMPGPRRSPGLKPERSAN